MRVTFYAGTFAVFAKLGFTTDLYQSSADAGPICSEGQSFFNDSFNPFSLTQTSNEHLCTISGNSSSVVGRVPGGRIGGGGRKGGGTASVNPMGDMQATIASQ